MKTGIISGSHRNPSQSEKVARHIAGRIEALQLGDSWLYTLADNPLPLWDQGLWENDKDWEQRMAPVHEQAAACDSFVIVTPEWHGQVPAGLKNLFLLLNRFDVGHKPALIVAVSSGDGGSYPVAELRMSSYKNNRICYLPEHLIIRNVESVLNEQDADNDAEADAYFRARIDWALGLLDGYAGALTAMRDSTQIFHEDFGNGM